MNLLKKIVYTILKPLVVIGFRFYFKKVVIVNPERRYVKGPVIANCNHPATVLDPFSSAFAIKRYFHFLTNIGLFRNKINAWLLDFLYCIPIERHIDMNGQPLNNEANFEMAVKFLSGGGCLHIAPEGLSIVERRMRKLKTGTARIALAAEKQNDFKLGLILQPVGLNYSDPLHFRTNHMIILGEPIKVADFKADYEKDPREAVRIVTDTLRQRLTDISIVTEDDEEDQLLLSLEDMQRTEKPLDMEGHFHRTKKLQAGLRTWKEKAPQAFSTFAESVNSYAEKLKLLKLSDLALKNPAFTKDFIVLLYAFPFFLIGYASHFLCCWFAKKSNDWFNDTEAFIPTFKFVTGIITFPLFYGLQIWFVNWITGNSTWTIIYALSIIPTGLVADWFLSSGKLFSEKWRLSTLRNTDESTVTDLYSQRKAIISNELVL